jgi:hypothetical protein
MKMKKLLSIFAIAFVFIGCDKKDDDPVVPSLEVVTNNMVGTYKITAATATQAGLTIDFYNTSSFPACQKDDIYTLTATTSTTGGYSISDGTVTCSPTTNTTGTYSVNTAAKTITINTSTSQTADVVSLTATTMVLSQPNFNGSSATVKVTYTKQ